MYIKHLSIIYLILVLFISVNSQNKSSTKKDKDIKAGTLNQEIASIDLASKDSPFLLAKAALTAHGGDKFKNIKSLVITGAVEAIPSGFPQSLSGSFVMIQAGENSRLQIKLPVFDFIQVNNGTTTASTLTAVNLPPLARYGILMLGKINEKDYKVTESSKKQPYSFSLISTKGDVIDFTLNPSTGLINSCSITSNIAGNQSKTVITYKKYKEIEGLWFPEEFYQGLDISQMTVSIKYRTKEVLIDKSIDDNLFTLKPSN